MTKNKRFINDIDYGQLIDTKGELSTIDYSDKVDFYELWEFLNKLADENEQLKKEKESWKSIACDNSSFNSILLHELDIAQEQGYKLSDPFKKLMREKND